MTTGQCALDLLAASLPHIDSDDDADDPPRLGLTTNEREALYKLANKPSAKRRSLLLPGNLIGNFISTRFPLDFHSVPRAICGQLATE